MKLITRLLAIARQRNYNISVDLDGWTARPLQVSHMLEVNFSVSDHFVVRQGHASPKQ